MLAAYLLTVLEPRQLPSVLSDQHYNKYNSIEMIFALCGSFFQPFLDRDHPTPYIIRGLGTPFLMGGNPSFDSFTGVRVVRG